MSEGLSESACGYVCRGLAVLPLHTVKEGRCTCGRADCRSPGKHPRTNHGVKEATTDEQQVKQWWTKWPDANVGIATGSQSDLIVIDVDGPLGEAILESLDLPSTPKVRTAKGAHLYFKNNGSEVGNGVRFLPDLDLRGEGGFVVAPPSLHANGTQYQWEVPLEDKDPADCPSWLQALTGDQQTRRVVREAFRDLAQAEAGQRNDELNKAAFCLGQLVAERRVPGEFVERALRAVAIHVGLSESEVRTTIDSGLTAAADGREQRSPARKRQRPRYRLLTDVEMEDRPPPEWIIDEVLTERGLTLIVGEPDTWKTFLALDWAFSIGTGAPWLGHDCLQGSVVFVAAEGGHGLGPRIKAWKITNDHEGEANVHFLPQAVPILDPWSTDSLIEAIREVPGELRLVIVDTMARCFGDGDENRSRDVGAFVSAVDRIRDETGAAVVVVHHTGKDPLRKERGSNALRAAADTMMLLRREKGCVRLTCDKQKDAPPFEPIVLRLQLVQIDDEVSSCVLEVDEIVVQRASMTNSERKALQTLDGLGTEGGTFSIWREASGLNEKTFANARKSLKRRGYVTRPGRSTQGECYTLTDEGREAVTAI